jgi:UDP-2,3-diacylglucosamine pyrophosphatase LpxH
LIASEEVRVVLVVISDLHFEEEESDFIIGEEGNGLPRDIFRRNTSAEAFRRLTVWLANEARRSQAQHMDLVLAGDIFDLHRTTLWFKENPNEARPYVSSAEVGEALENKVLGILTATANEKEVSKSLEVFRLLANGRYLEKPEGPDQKFPAVVTLHYLPGNHDRLANSTSNIRNEVRRLLGLEDGGTPFPNVLLFDHPGDPQVLVRHGHEYDRYNFSVDYSDKNIPAHIPETEYDDPAFGDFITVEVAARLPSLFREEYQDSDILESEVLSTIYLRLLRFDDLRPQSALLDFLLNIRRAPELGLSQQDIWERLAPIARRLLSDISEHPFLRDGLHKLEKRWQPDPIDAVQLFLDSKIWKSWMPLRLLTTIQNLNNNVAIAGRDETPGPERFAAREDVLQRDSPHFIVAGHTHKPQIELLAAKPQGDIYYVNTGTWRTRIFSAQERKDFARLRARTYVIFYGSTEREGALEESFDYWDGTYRSG